MMFPWIRHQIDTCLPSVLSKQHLDRGRQLAKKCEKLAKAIKKLIQ